MRRGTDRRRRPWPLYISLRLCLASDVKSITAEILSMVLLCTCHKCHRFCYYFHLYFWLIGYARRGICHHCKNSRWFAWVISNFAVSKYVSKLHICTALYTVWLVSKALGYGTQFFVCLLPFSSSVCFFYCVRFSFLSTKPKDWLGRYVFKMTCFVSTGM